MVKYIFVTGGVVSGLGKGIMAASLGRLLKERGYRVTIKKCDPYLNLDPGTMSPYQHGEVFVTDDGAETDLDLGHYERFIDENLDQNSSITSGKIYSSVLAKERRGDYLGGTVQVIPHVTTEIKNQIYRHSNSDVVITEIGGTVGDIEGQPFLEAIRQIASEVGRENVVFIHLTLIPCIPGTRELKSKPTQHSVKQLLSLGIQPDIIVCRSEYPIPDEMRKKIALFCNTRREDVIENITVASLYEAPLMLEREGLATAVCHHLKLRSEKPDLEEWNTIVRNLSYAERTVTIGVVGKYVSLPDAYLSITESLHHAGIPNHAQVEVKLVDSEHLTQENVGIILKGCDGILIPGGFGNRGIEGKLNAIRYARESKIPFLGICLGMQMAVVEFARDVLGLADAHSSEINPDTPHPVIHIMSEQLGIENLGGTMRLGAYPCQLESGSLAHDLYQTDLIHERHRHRYEFNNTYRQQMEQNGLRLSGLSPDGSLVEIVELTDHPFFVGVQFHPEFKSRPNRPHPLFCGFVKAALSYKEQQGGIQ